MNYITTLKKSAALAAAIAAPLLTALADSTPYPMAGGDYTNDFSDAVKWPAGLGGTDTTAANWAPVATNAVGTIPDGQRTTISSAKFSSSNSGGIQTNSPVGSLTFLATGNSDNTSAVAVDLLLDFTGRNAGTLGFDWAGVNNSTGDRVSSLRVYASTDGSTWTELTDAFVSATNNVAASGTLSGIALPDAFNGSSTARIRFYEYNGVGGSTGSRAKIAIDNLSVTSTGASGAPPAITGLTPASVDAHAGDTVTIAVTATGDAPTYSWYKIIGNTTNLIAGATTARLTLANVLAADAAGYQVVLANATGVATSDVVTVTVADPFITMQPVSVNGLLGAPVVFTVNANGTAPLACQWYTKPGSGNDDFTGMTPLANGGRISGADATALHISGLAAGDAGYYFAVITGGAGSVTSSVVALTAGSTAALAFWDFNGNLNVANPVPAAGFGTASAVNCAAFSNNVASANDYGAYNNAWGTSTYPAAGVSNKTAGVRFDVSTVGAHNITVSYDTRVSSTGSKYERLQFTTNGVDFVDYPVSSSFYGSGIYESREFDLTGFPGVRNNPNFGVRIVTEFESTATLGAVNNDQYLGASGTYNPSGTVSYDLVSINGDALTDANQPPVVSAFTDVTLADTDGPLTLNFTVGDDTTPAASLAVSVTSLNQQVLSDGSLALGGSGASRTLTLTPTPGLLGTAPVMVTVTDAQGEPIKTWFNVTFAPGNEPPTISGLTNTNMIGGTPAQFAFTVNDDKTPASSLVVSAVSGNSTLIPGDSSHLAISGSGTDRTLTVTPAAGQYGTAPITVTVNDGAKTTSATFVLVVRPSALRLLNDAFDYDNSGAIINVSAGFWQTHSGTAGQMQVANGAVTVTANQTEDCNAPLIGAPYSVARQQTLYASFTVNYISLPTVNGAYFAHFKDAGTGFYGRVFASTLNAAPGAYRLGICNTGNTNAIGQVAQDLMPGVTYTIVTRFVMTNGACTLWINPADESSPGATDASAVSSSSINPVTSYALRQNSGEGTVAVGHLKVGLSFARVTTDDLDLQPIPLDFSYADGKLTLTWSNPAFTLQTSTNVAGPYVDVPGAGSPFVITPAASGQPAQFFRLQSAP